MSERRDLSWRAAQTPDAPALEIDSVVWSFADLADCACRGTAYLRAMAPPGDAPIALLLPGDERFAGWFHAIASSGHTVVPMNYRLTAVELAQQLATARVGVLLGAAGDARLGAIAASVPGLHVEIAPRFESLPAPNDSRPMAAIEDGAPLVVLFTSGTSGPAKGACLSRGNFEASARAAEERLGTAVYERWLACMPVFHVGGLSMLMRSVLFGGPVRLQPRFDAAAVSNALEGGDISGVSLVPTMLSRLLAHRAGRRAPPGLRVLLLGGAAAAPDLLARATAAGYPVCPTYGLTEATSQVATAAPPTAGTAGTNPMRPVLGAEVRIMSGDREVPAGTPGEITVRGPSVTRGYLHDPDATARALRDGWLHTGDIGYLDAAGALHVLDRRDDLIVSGGENVYPAEIEAVLLEHPAVEEAGVAGIADPDLGARVVAWIVAVPGSSLQVEALRQHCRDRLAGFKQPREFRFVDRLPRNAAGKLQRRSLGALQSRRTE